jgi:D-alanyl-D-alanine carboxypeptidase
MISGLLWASIAFTSITSSVHAEEAAVIQNYEKVDVQVAIERELTAIMAEADFPGITASLIMPDGIIIDAATGYADAEEDEAMQPGHVMPAGSVGKTFIVAASLQIAAEHGLDLDSPLAVYIGDHAWYQGMPNGDTITLRMLLNHTSGIVASQIDHPSIFPLFEQTFGPDGRSMADLGFENIDDAVALTDSDAQFPAGQGWAYSDANYILAGLLIEDICSCIIFQEIQNRFINSLNLASTLPTPRTSSRYAAGYEKEAGVLPGAPRKLTISGRLYYDPALEWAGGGIASNSHDLARWAKDLFSAEAITPEQLNEMVRSTSDAIPAQLGWKYGLGVQIANDSRGLRLMHGGYIPGYSTYIEYQAATNMSLALQINTRSGFGANRQIADKLWVIISKFVETPSRK